MQRTRGRYPAPPPKNSSSEFFGGGEIASTYVERYSVHPVLYHRYRAFKLSANTKKALVLANVKGMIKQPVMGLGQPAATVAVAA